MKTKFVLLLIAVFSFCANAIAGTKVQIKTSHGNIIVELDEEKAPITSKNFLAYVDSGFYTNTVFHRVIDGFMIQGGGFTKDMLKKETKAPIKLEAKNGLSNTTGTIAMARTRDPNSATSQFFINVDNIYIIIDIHIDINSIAIHIVGINEVIAIVNDNIDVIINIDIDM